MTKNEECLWDCWKEFVSTYEGSGFSYQFIKQSECVAPVRNVMRLTVPIRPLATPFIYMKVQKEFEQWLKDKHNWKIKLYFHVVVCTVTCISSKPAKQWVGLTDEEVSDVIDNVLEGGGWLDVARALEAAIKRKNA